MKRAAFFVTLWHFVRQHPSIIYSMLLVVVVPSVLAGYGWWSISSFEKVLEINLQRRGVFAHDVLSLFVRDSLHDPVQLQQRITELEQVVGSDIADYTVLNTTDNGRTFISTAGFQKETRLREVFTKAQYALAWNSQQAIATTVQDTASNTRLLLITKPLTDSTGEQWGLANVAISLAEHDRLTAQAIQRSVVAMALGVLVVLLLIANHTRLFSYAVLLQKHEEVDRLKDDFIAVASHELRTPITGIKSFLSLVQEGSFGKLNDSGQHYVMEALHRAGQLDNLISDMLDVSRIEQGRLEFAPDVISIAKAVAEVTEELQFRAKEKGLVLSVTQHDAADIFISVDPNHFRRILVNLIGNAIKYTPQGSVTISITKSDHDTVSVSVQDTGIGIPPDKLETLFQKFSRVHTDETAKIQGTGLGLWITKALTEKMGGKLYVASIHGKGSEFTIMFPRHEPPKAT